MGRFGPTHRKIPVPKRHGIRDPLKRIAEREAAVKDKVNNPPKEYDVQEVSNRFKRFMALAKAANDPEQKAKRPKKTSKLQIAGSVLEKRPRETEEAFLNRAGRIQEDREIEAKIGTKFGVEVKHDDKSGAIRIIKRKGIEVDDMLQKISDDKTPSGVRKTKAAETAKERKAMLAEQKALRKQKVLERQREEEDLLLREFQYERVPFGEVVKEPPTLHTLPRRATRDGVPRPGSKGLLLSSLLQQKQAEDEEPVPKKSSKKKEKETKLDLKGKRKKLPIATRMKIEREQQSVIEMYRQLKKKLK